ncbi:MAG TPA: hypothetical protein VGM76_01050 [Lacipirellulaceae bacterium]|jgi:hypothetical protein
MFRAPINLLAILLLNSLLAGLAWAEATSESGQAKAVDPSGTWKWDTTFNDNKAEFTLKLKWDGKQLTGKYTAFDNTTDVDEGKLDKDQLSFISHREFNGNKFDVHFNGKVEADDINGKISLDFGQGPQEFDWHAKRSVDVEDVLGLWELRLETPNGVIEPHITITKDEKGLHGAYVSPFGERDAKNVEFKDGQLSWEISGDRDGNSFKAVYRGKPQGDTIKGTNEFDFGGNTGTADFTGKRTPPDEKKAAEAKPAAVAPSTSPTAQ